MSTLLCLWRSPVFARAPKRLGREGRPVGQRARSSSKAVRRVKEKFPMTVAQKKMKAHMQMSQWKGVCGAQTETVLQYPPSLGNTAVSHTVLRQGAWTNPRISPSACGWKSAHILWAIKVEMSRVHLVSQDFEGGNILYLSLMGTPWISRHSCCRLYLMNYSSLQKCHYKSYSQATLNAVLGTHVRSYCWKTHVVSCSASVKKVGEHHIRPGRIFHHTHQCWLQHAGWENHINPWNSVTAWTIFAWGVFLLSMCRLFLL